MSRDKYYDSKRWHKKRDRILRLDGYIDKVESRFGRTIEATLVHHIYPRDEYPEYEWEDWNLISVSKSTHQRLHDRNTGKLSKEGQALMRRTKIGINWRKSNGKQQIA